LRSKLKELIDHLIELGLLVTDESVWDGSLGEEEELAINRMGFLIRNYAVTAWAFEIVELIRKMVFSTLVAFLFSGSSMQLFSCFFLAIIVLLLYQIIRPYKDPRVSKMLLWANLGLVLTLFYAILLTWRATVEDDKVLDNAINLLNPLILLINLSVLLFPFIIEFWVSYHGPTKVVRRLITQICGHGNEETDGSEQGTNDLLTIMRAASDPAKRAIKQTGSSNGSFTRKTSMGTQSLLSRTNTFAMRSENVRLDAFNLRRRSTIEGSEASLLASGGGNRPVAENTRQSQEELLAGSPLSPQAYSPEQLSSEVERHEKSDLAVTASLTLRDSAMAPSTPRYEEMDAAALKVEEEPVQNLVSISLKPCPREVKGPEIELSTAPDPKSPAINPWRRVRREGHEV